MLSVRSLGQTDDKRYREVGNCGVVSGGGIFSSSSQPCRTWAAADLPAAFPNGGTVFAADLNSNIDYFPTPQSVVDKLGRCQAIWTGYSQGFAVPTVAATEVVEPGVYHPSKSWATMIDESHKLRANDPSIQAPFAACTETPTPIDQGFVRSSTGTLTLRNPDGSTKCESPELQQSQGIVASWTARLPAQYQKTLPILQTAAMWLASDSSSWSSTRGVDQTRAVGPFTDRIICGSQPTQSTAVEWGHKYDVLTATAAQVGPTGILASVDRRLEGPVLQVYVNPNAGPAASVGTAWTSLWTLGTGGNLLASLAVGLATNALINAAVQGQWINLSPSQVKIAMSTGQWPLPGTERARWMDTQQEFDPKLLTTLPTTSSPQTASTSATAFGVIGIVVGIVLLAVASRGKS
jgi:hypothetical protein